MERVAGHQGIGQIGIVRAREGTLEQDRAMDVEGQHHADLHDGEVKRLRRVAEKLAAGEGAQRCVVLGLVLRMSIEEPIDVGKRLHLLRDGRVLRIRRIALHPVLVDLAEEVQVGDAGVAVAPVEGGVRG